jgi:hypothetical protein
VDLGGNVSFGLPAFTAPMGATSGPPTVPTPTGPAAPNELALYGQ